MFKKEIQKYMVRSNAYYTNIDTYSRYFKHICNIIPVTETKNVKIVII